MKALGSSYPYTVTLDSPYASISESACELFRQGSLGNGVSGYQYIVTFDSNVGDLPALTVDGSGLTDSYNNETSAEVRQKNSNGHVLLCLEFSDVLCLPSRTSRNTTVALIEVRVSGLGVFLT